MNPAIRRMTERTNKGVPPEKTGNIMNIEMAVSPVITDMARTVQPEIMRINGRNIFKDFIIKIIGLRGLKVLLSR